MSAIIIKNKRSQVLWKLRLPRREVIVCTPIFGHILPVVLRGRIESVVLKGRVVC